MDEEVFESRGRDARLAPPAEDRSGLSPTSPMHSRRSPIKSFRYSVADPYPEFCAILGDDGLSVSQKELASRLYSALKTIANWLRELEAWIWINSLGQERPFSPHDTSAQGDSSTAPQDFEPWESLPSLVVDEYERQLDAIFEELDRMALDELKEMVLDIHQGNSRPSSSYSTMTESKLAFLDDFSFFVTSVMLQILPQYAKLKQRLNTWTIRISVLQLVPKFLEQIHLLRLEMERIWPELAREVPTDNSSLYLEQNRLESMKGSVQGRISYTGRILDDMLDLLEGQADVLPVKWIDNFENLESDFSSWTIESERKIFNLKSANPPSPTSVINPISDNIDITETSLSIPTRDALDDCTLKSPGLTENADSSSMSPQPVLDPENHPVMASQYHDTWDQEYTTPAKKIEHSDLKTEAQARPEAIHSPNKTFDPPELAASGTAGEETQNPPSATSDDISYSPESSPMPSSPVYGLRDSPISTPSSPIDETTIRYRTEDPNVKTPPMYAADDDSLLLPEVPRLSIIADLDEANATEPDDSPLQNRLPAKISTPPLNSLMKKRKEKDQTLQISHLPDEADPSGTGDEGTTEPRISPVAPSMPLEEQISSILEAIPTPIKFKSGPNANDPEIRRPRLRSTSSQLRRAAANAVSHIPTLTLAPADEHKLRRSANDPDIRLYHLIQTGRDKPIKLFIRRVGENGERVMVRVGGGWADLGEYLRIYAEHHGRRTVSDGRVEIQPLAAPAAGTSTPKTSNSRRSSLRSQSRPGSTTPMAEPGTRPGSALASPQNYLDTPQSASFSASRRLTSWGEAGLAGPFAKKADVSDEKQEWIDGIVEQAKRGMGNIDVGDLGKTGSTRRVFFKGKSPAPDF